MRAYDVFWMSNRDWYKLKNGVRIIKEDAPKEAQESFDNYLKQKGLSKEQLLDAMNKPIPAGIAFFRHSGNALATLERRPVIEKIRNTMPDTRMMTRPA